VAGPRYPEPVAGEGWAEIHPHVKPIGLITRLIGAVTKPGELVVDPAAGSFVVMRAANQLGREFIGCDIAYRACIEERSNQPVLPLWASSQS
jgi:hypothetical protein